MYTLPVLNGQSEGDERPIPKQNVEVLHFEPLTYPLFARVRSIQGIAVLKAIIDSGGKVSDVKVLSAPEALQQDAVNNLRQWRFSSPRGGWAIVVYWFRISGVCEPPCRSGFEVHPPNLVIVTTGSEIATP